MQEVDTRFEVPKANFGEVGPFLYAGYTETSFAESKLNFSFWFCLGICFCVEVHFTL